MLLLQSKYFLFILSIIYYWWYLSHFFYLDIRELIEVDDVMDDDALRFGPNGGLVFCME